MFIASRDDRADAEHAIQRGTGNVASVHTPPRGRWNFVNVFPRRHAFHEVLHALTWPLFDEAEAAIRSVPDSRLRKELMDRSIDARENVVYELERKIGPLCFPSLPWVDP